MTDNNQPLRVGVIGVGFGTTVHIPGLQAEGIEVAAVAARRQERAQEAADKFNIPNTFTDYRKMLEMPDLDFISIASPHHLHREMTEAALAAGKHVLCEKPFATNVEEAKAMLDAANKTDKTVMVAHEFRWAPQRSYVKELLDQGYIGNMREVHAHLFMGPRRAPRPRPATNPDLGLHGGFLWGLGSHYLDAYRHWFGDIVSVQALMRAQMPERVDRDTQQTSTTETDDTFSVVVEFANGGWGTLMGSIATPFGQGAGIEIFGDEGSLSAPQPLPLAFNPPPEGKVYGAHFGDEGPERAELPMPEKHRPFDDERDHRLMAYRLMVREFVKGMEEGTSPAPNFQDGYRLQRVLDGAVESAQTGRRVAIPLN